MTTNTQVTLRTNIDKYIIECESSDEEDRDEIEDLQIDESILNKE